MVVQHRDLDRTARSIAGHGRDPSRLNARLEPYLLFATLPARLALT
jgi:hypothetical protein